MADKRKESPITSTQLVKKQKQDALVPASLGSSEGGALIQGVRI